MNDFFYIQENISSPDFYTFLIKCVLYVKKFQFNGIPRNIYSAHKNRWWNDSSGPCDLSLSLVSWFINIAGYDV